MKILLPGLSQAVILRRPARFRTGRLAPFHLAMGWEPNIDPTVLTAEYSLKSAVIRKCFYSANWSPDTIVDLADRCAGAPAGFPFGFWLFNEQVVQFLVAVEDT